MDTARRAALLCLSIGLAACERAKSPVPVDTSALRAAHAADSVAIAASPTRNWDANAGPVLLIPAGTADQAFVIAPDSAQSARGLSAIPRPAAVTLFARNGAVQSAELPAVADTSVCAIERLTAAPPPRPWNIGFIGGVVAPVAMDSIQSFNPTDSAMLAAGTTRLASALPNDPAGRFIGLPFVARAIWRFSIPQGSQVVVTSFVRQINQEATPLQERTLLVAERPANDTTLTTAYWERSYGDEETIESRDVLAAVLLGAARTPALIISHDFGDATAYGLLERVSDGRWHSRWLSGRRQCAAPG